MGEPKAAKVLWGTAWQNLAYCGKMGTEVETWAKTRLVGDNHNKT